MPGDYVRLRSDADIQHDVEEAHAHEERIRNAAQSIINGCSHCDHVCQSTVDSEKLDQVYRWMDELMPVARAAAKLFNAKAKLMSRWVK